MTCLNATFDKVREALLRHLDVGSTDDRFPIHPVRLEEPMIIVALATVVAGVVISIVMPLLQLQRV